MAKPDTPTALANATGISLPYASQLLSDNPKQRRDPSRALAIQILRKTGWRHPVLSGLTDDQIATLEAIEPWVPVADRPVEAQVAA